jgi:hypothetical protein
VTSNPDNMFDKKLMNSPGNDKLSQNNLKSTSAHKISDLLVQNNNNNNHMMQNLINQQQNGYLKFQQQQQHQQQTAANSRSNTLDRKMRQSYIHVDNNNQTNPSASLSFKLFSNSLERNKQHQQQKLIMHQQQQQQLNNETNKQLFYSNRLNLNNHEITNKKQTNNNTNKKSLKQDTILENPNTIYLSASNDDLINMHQYHKNGHVIKL